MDYHEQSIVLGTFASKIETIKEENDAYIQQWLSGRKS